MKALTILIAILSLTAAVEAKANKQNAAKAKQAKQAELQKKKEKKEKENKREAINAVLKAKDKNDDGSLTKDEYLTGEADQEAASKRFDQFNKNGDRSLSRSELEESLGL